MSKRRSAKTSSHSRSRATSSTPPRSGHGTTSSPPLPRGKPAVTARRPHVIVLPKWASWCIAHWRGLVIATAAGALTASYLPTLQYYAARGYIAEQCKTNRYSDVVIERALCTSADHCTEREMTSAMTIQLAMELRGVPCRIDAPTRPDERLARLLTRFAPEESEPTEPEPAPGITASAPSLKPQEVAERG